jgi:hypothetical protein
MATIRTIQARFPAENARLKGEVDRLSAGAMSIPVAFYMPVASYVMGMPNEVHASARTRSRPASGTRRGGVLRPRRSTSTSPAGCGPMPLSDLRVPQATPDAPENRGRRKTPTISLSGENKGAGTKDAAYGESSRHGNAKRFASNPCVECPLLGDPRAPMEPRERRSNTGRGYEVSLTGRWLATVRRQCGSALANGILSREPEPTAARRTEPAEVWFAYHCVRA